MQLQRRNNKSTASSNNRYVNVQEKTYINDGEGGTTETWTTKDDGSNIPMSIWPMAEQRRAELRTYNVDATHYIKTRYGVDIVESNNRILYGSRIFEILTIANPQEKNVDYLITAKEYRE